MMKGINRRRRGATMVELLMASLVTTVGVLGLFNLFSYCQLNLFQQRLTSVATQIARADVEKAKLMGYDNLPLGTYNSGTGVATWTGAPEFYDREGNKLPNSTGAMFKLERIVKDTGMTQVGSSYMLSETGKRTVLTRVKRPSDRDMGLVTMGTVLAKGGI